MEKSESPSSPAPRGLLVVGRTNVGKTTLINKLCGSNDGLSDNSRHTTRDVRQALIHDSQDHRHLPLWDTPGPDDPWTPDEGGAWPLPRAFLFVVDGKAGPHPLDKDLARSLRRSGRDCLTVVNKLDGGNQAPAAEFRRLAVGDLLGVSALDGRGMAYLRETLLDRFGQSDPGKGEGLRLAVIGRPNAGKSSLINAILGESRLLVGSAPGTTRDVVEGAFLWRGTPFRWADTPGVRKKNKIKGLLESASVGKAIQVLRRVDVAILAADAAKGLGDQDRRLFHLARQFCEVVVAATKLDSALEADQDPAAMIGKFFMVPEGVEVVETSAHSGRGLEGLRRAVLETARISSGESLEGQRAWGISSLKKCSRAVQSLRVLRLAGVSPLRFSVEGPRLGSMGEQSRKSLRRAICEDLGLANVRVLFDDEGERKR